MSDFVLLCCIVSHEKGSRALRIAKQNGITGGSIFLARGTATSRLLEILDIHDSRMEFVIMLAGRETARKAADAIAHEMSFHKRWHGIAFIIAADSLYGSHSVTSGTIAGKTEDDDMFKAVFTIVDLGRAEKVIEAANAAGARGGTVIHARGSGIHETQVLFSMPVEPEREIVMTLVPDGIADAVISSIRENLSLDEPGNGIIFVIDTEKTYGLYS